jgi:hypothetical protein
VRIDSLYENPADHHGCLLELVWVEEGTLALLCTDHGTVIFDMTREPAPQVNETCMNCQRPMIIYCPDCEEETPTRIGGWPIH